MPTPVAEEATDEEDLSCLPMHRVLEPGFILKSKAFMLTFNSRTVQEDSWPEFRAWVEEKNREFGARAWAACLERSCNADLVEGRPRCQLHAYFFWTDGVGVYHRNLRHWCYQNINPRVDQCLTPRKLTPRVAASRGLWYVSIMKRGTLQSDSNFTPWVDYKPRLAWFDDLYEQGKLSHSQYQAFSRHFPHGYAARTADVAKLLMDEEEAVVTLLVSEEMAALRAAGFWKEPRHFQEKEQFLRYFDATPRSRRPLLAIIGGTGTGKSILGGTILEELARRMGLAGFVEITVEDDAHLDFSDFRVSSHAGVLLDGVGDVLTLKRYREELQGRPKVMKGGRSSTMRYAYPFTLARRAVIATFDLSAANLHMFRTDHWLKDPSNVLQLRLQGSAWQREEDISVEAPPNASEVMSSWSVAETARFLREVDLEGPATVCAANGVNGADLLRMTVSELCEDLRLTPFAAKKVCAAKAQFVAQ